MTDEDKLAELKAETAVLEKKIKEKESTVSDEEAECACILHDALCRYNHTDGCSWHYELHGKYMWNGHAHNAYLKKARKLLEYCKDNEIDPEIGCKIVIFAKDL